MLRSQSWPRLELEEDSLEVLDTILVTEPPSHQVRRAPASVLVSQRNGIFYSLDEGDQAPGSERGLPGENKRHSKIINKQMYTKILTVGQVQEPPWD